LAHLFATFDIAKFGHEKFTNGSLKTPLDSRKREFPVSLNKDRFTTLISAKKQKPFDDFSVSKRQQ
jgi:hypothetical protein